MKAFLISERCGKKNRGRAGIVGITMALTSGLAAVLALAMFFGAPALDSLGPVTGSAEASSCCDSHTEDRAAENENSVDKWTCPMHPDAVSEEPGKCPICNMDLVLAERGADVDVHTDQHMQGGADSMHETQDDIGVRDRERQSMERAGDLQEWTCGMHPSIRSAQPGKCPICNMDLVPVEKGAGDGLVEIDPDRARLVGLEHAGVEYMPLVKRFWAVGEVEYDETRVVEMASRIPGRIEDLKVDFTGARVARGDVLLTIYSPQLITALDEYQHALESGRGSGRDSGTDSGRSSGRSGSRAIAESARRKLVLWGLSEKEIDVLMSGEEMPVEIPVRSPIAGIVIERMAAEGEYVMEGENLYVIADLSRVWIMTRVYEEDIRHVTEGDEVRIVADAFPNEGFHGRVGFVDPYMDGKTRTLGVRVEVENMGEKLKPGMYARATFEAPLSREEGMFYTCPMHPEIISQGPGECPKCGMYLEKVEGGRVLAVPKAAVIRAGKASVVYVRKGEWVYEPRQIEVGDAASLRGDDGADYYQVLDGLMPGDVVVTAGSFLVDSQARLTGQAVSAYGGALSAEPHQHQH